MDLYTTIANLSYRGKFIAISPSHQHLVLAIHTLLEGLEIRLGRISNCNFSIIETSDGLMHDIYVLVL